VVNNPDKVTYSWEQLNHKVQMPDGTWLVVPFDETFLHKLNLSWGDALSKVNATNPLVLMIHTSCWQNRLGRRFEQVMAYRIEVTRSGSMSSIVFLPERVVFQNY
jgi:hypothetical protein